MYFDLNSQSILVVSTCRARIWLNERAFWVGLRRLAIKKGGYALLVIIDCCFSSVVEGYLERILALICGITDVD